MNFNYQSMVVTVRHKKTKKCYTLTCVLGVKDGEPLLKPEDFDVGKFDIING